MQLCIYVGYAYAYIHTLYIYISIFYTYEREREREREAEGVREEPEEAGREAVEEEEKLFNTLIKDLCEPLLAVAGIANMSQKMTKSPVNFESWDNDKALHSMNQKSHTAGYIHSCK